MRTSAPDVVGEEFVSAGADGVEVGIPSGHGRAQGGVPCRERLEVPDRFAVIDDVSDSCQQPILHRRLLDLLQGRGAPSARISSMYAETTVVCCWT